MKITKEICDRFLNANTKNRNLSPNRVEAIARAMKNGEFVPNNGQTIVVTRSWLRLLDGQHRLYAMRRAGVYGFDIPIVEVPDDEADSVFNTIDVVRGARKTNQVISITTGIANTNAVCALISQFLFIAFSITSPSPNEIIRFYNRYESVILKIKVHMTCVIGKIKPHAAVLAGVLNAIIISGKEDEIINRFHNMLENKCITSSDNLLLNMIVSSKGKSDKVTEFIKTTKALLNPDLKVLKVADNEEIAIYKAKSY